MGKLRLSPPRDFRFTEAIVNEYADINEVKNYDIAFEKGKTCNVSERFPGVNGTKICQNCYYTELGDKMEKIRKSKRKDFMKYQLSLREDKLTWLNEFEELLVDNESQFDRVDYSFAREYKDIVDELRSSLNGEEIENNSDSIFGNLQELIAERIVDSLPSDISDSAERFCKDYPEESVTAFLIMQFTETDVHKEIINTIKHTLSEHNIVALRADDKEYSDDLFSNIKTYMHCCDFGIAIFERITEDDFNPNVSLEVGYMMGLKKPVCLLKDKSLKNLHTDLAGKLYKPVNLFKIQDSISKNLNKWLVDKEII